MIFPRKSRMPVRTQEKLLEHFVAGATARAAAELVGVQGRTAVVFFQRLRQLVASKQESFVLSGEIEADESYFGGVRKGKRGRGAAGKVPVFGLLKRGGRVYTAIIPDAKAATIIPIIRDKVTPDSIVYTDSFQVYDVLDVSEFHHKRVNHSQTFVNKRGHHINGIENFWNQSKRHLRRFNGIPKSSFYWFLKECEWRFNGGNHNALLKQLKSWYQSEINKP
ncbi:MAG: IS1595 family transposase [Rhodospirillales bacterium]|nr:IS1595 family transposase [Alphaproteobacteria bacterium]MCB9987423.1 IS1595 family transposase [Rhodospirillales bacterium]USO07595.1 MAG: IS1595 family transposase [Rhodospirillales bacterium]